MATERYGLLLGWDRLHAASATVISASSEQVGYEARNLKTDRLAGQGFQWRSAAAALSGVTVTIDLGSTKTIRGSALVGSNLTPGVATRQVLYSANADMSSPVGDSGSGIAIDNTAAGVAAESPPWGETVAHILSADVTARYIRWTVTDAANPYDYLRASVALAGKVWQPGRNASAASSEFTTKLAGSLALKVPIRGARMQWTLNDQEKADLEPILVSLKGSRRVLFVRSPLDLTAWRASSIWCYSPEDVPITPAQKRKWWNVSLQLIEADE